MSNTQQQMLQSYNHTVHTQNVHFVVYAVIMLSVFILLAIIKARIQKKHRRPTGRKRTSSANSYGVEGERMVAHQLAFLGAGYRVMNDILLTAQRRTQQIDHLVVGPNGVFHVETKHWSGEVVFEGGGMLHLKDGIATGDKDPTEQMYRHQDVLEDALRGIRPKVDVTGIICFSHPRCRLRGASRVFTTVTLDNLQDAIRHHRATRSLTEVQMESILKVIEQHSQPTPAGYGQGR